MVDTDAIIRELGRVPGRRERLPPQIDPVLGVWDGVVRERIQVVHLVPVLPIVAVIRYRAADGAVSVRRVRFRKFGRSSAGNEVVECWCYERHALRTFLLDRIEAVTDVDSGEVIDTPLRLAAMFAEASAERIRYSWMDETDGALAASSAGVTVLAWLARSDGMLHPQEVEIIADYVEALTEKAGLYRPNIITVVSALMPTESDFFDALTVLRDQAPSAVRCLARHALALIEADGVISDDEFRWLLELRAAMQA